MFTGIVTDRGKVRTLSEKESAVVLGIECAFNDAILGESIAVNGVCLTVVTTAPNYLEFFVSYETLRKTAFHRLAIGDQVNLERALKLSDRLSGHLVYGHVDGTGEIISIREKGESKELKVRLPIEALTLVIEKGSIALDGISLTVNEIERSDAVINLTIIPHTWDETNLRMRKVGDLLNIELDVIGKYVKQFSKPYGGVDK